MNRAWSRRSFNPTSSGRGRLIGLIGLLSSVVLATGCGQSRLAEGGSEARLPFGESVMADTTAYRFEQVIEAARLAASHEGSNHDAPLTLHAASADLPPALAQMDYEGYIGIGFDQDHAERLGEADGYSLQGFHRGWLYHDPVHIERVADGRSRPWAYKPEAFKFGNAAPQPDGTWGKLGWAGLKINRAWEAGGDPAELMVLLGASYYRALGADSVYGASGRLIAVNTGIPGMAESFPRITSLWVHEQTDRDQPLRVDGYLAGEHLTGAFSLLIHPGKTTAIDVDLHLFIRKPIQKLGLAPITSMYMFGPEADPRFRDARPEVHDNDALLVHTTKQVYFQPLRNPLADRTYRLDAEQMTGFGLIQRERRFDRYLDPVTRHELRPDVYVQPTNAWPKGAVEVLELARLEEKIDNIGCYYAVDNVEAGRALHVKYTVAFGSPIAEVYAQRQDFTAAAVDHDRTPADRSRKLTRDPGSTELDPGRLGQAQRVVFAQTPWPHWEIIFDGPALRELEEGAYVPCVCIDRAGQYVTPAVHRLPDGRWRVDLSADLAYPIDIRFEHQGKPLTETVRLQEPIR